MNGNTDTAETGREQAPGEHALWGAAEIRRCLARNRERLCALSVWEALNNAG